MSEVRTTLPEGWYEFVAMITATTHVAYVRESGEVYTPDADPLDFINATIVHRLVRETETETEPWDDEYDGDYGAGMGRMFEPRPEPRGSDDVTAASDSA